MRLLDRDRRTVYVALFEGREAELDDSGRYTGRHVLAYADPVALLASVGAAKGEAAGAVFGTSLDYDRVLLIDDADYEVDEHSRLWVENDPTADEPHDYTVERVARTPNCTALAIKRVEAAS